MELLDKRGVVNEAGGGFPSEPYIADPSYKVLQGLVAATAMTLQSTILMISHKVHPQ